MLSIENPKIEIEEDLETLSDSDSESEEADETLPFNYSITSYGADYPTDSLVKRLDRGDIYVPDFQRGYVWKLKEASKFIESLLLGLPVPGIFLAREQETQKLLVIDGQQRLRTIQYFYNGIFNPTGKKFILNGTSSSQFDGKAYESLNEEDRRRLDDSIIPATIIKQDEPDEPDELSKYQSSIYLIFERLNTGGSRLKEQQIRACLYHGSFNNLIKELNKNPEWRKVYGDIDLYMKDQEYILRFLALYFWGDKYTRPMKGFLNGFMSMNRELQTYSNEDISNVFVNTINLISSCIGNKAFRLKSQRINASIFDAVMVGIASRLKKGSIINEQDILSRYEELLKNQNFLDASVETARTTETLNVKTRLREAINSFVNVV